MGGDSFSPVSASELPDQQRRPCATRELVEERHGAPRQQHLSWAQALKLARELLRLGLHQAQVAVGEIEPGQVEHAAMGRFADSSSARRVARRAAALSVEGSGRRCGSPSARPAPW